MENKKGIIHFLPLLLVAVIAVGVWWMWKSGNLDQMGFKKTQNNQDVTKTDVSTQDIPSDWTYNSFPECSLGYHIPPNKEPYIESLLSPEGQISPGDTPEDYRRYWQNSGGEQNYPMFDYTLNIVHVADIEASGFISGGVFVMCGKNKESLTTDELITNYLVESNKTNYPGYTYNVEVKESISKWDHDVVYARIEGGLLGPEEYYFLATENYIYRISKRSHSEDQFVQDTTDQILSTLRFDSGL